MGGWGSPDNIGKTPDAEAQFRADLITVLQQIRDNTTSDESPVLPPMNDGFLAKAASPEVMSRFHIIMVIAWTAAIIPSLLWWKDSILFVILISLWANVAAHWAGFQGAHSEKRLKQHQEETGTD